MSQRTAERERLMAEQERLLRVGVPLEDLVKLSDAVLSEKACRRCGCTDADCSGCIERTGEACHWVESDLCSACA